jgi:hypothetical protein
VEVMALCAVVVSLGTVSLGTVVIVRLLLAVLLLSLVLLALSLFVDPRLETSGLPWRRCRDVFLASLRSGNPKT